VRKSKERREEERREATNTGESPEQSSRYTIIET